MITEKEKRSRNTKVGKILRVNSKGKKWPVRGQATVIALRGLVVISIFVSLTTSCWAETTKEANDMGILLSAANDHLQKAGKCLEDSLFVALKSPHKSKALMHQRKKQIDIAIQLCQTVLEKSPKTPESAKARLLIADAFARLQRPQELINEQIELAFEDDVKFAKETIYGEHMEKTVNALKSVEKISKFLANANSKKIGLSSTNLGQSFKAELENMITEAELMRYFGADYSKINQAIENSVFENMLVK